MQHRDRHFIKKRATFLNKIIYISRILYFRILNFTREIRIHIVDNVDGYIEVLFPLYINIDAFKRIFRKEFF